MANHLPTEKKVNVISLLCEDMSIRGIERATGVNRNTIMSLGLRVGTACAKIHDEKMRGLKCKQIEVDEIWGFIGKKKKNADVLDTMAGMGTFGRSLHWTRTPSLFPRSSLESATLTTQRRSWPIWQVA